MNAKAARRTSWSMTRGAGWIIRRHPRLFIGWVGALIALLVAGHLRYAGGLAAVVLIPAAAGSYAGRRWPATWRRLVRGPRDRRKWKRRARQQWAHLSDACRLSQDYRATKLTRTRRGKLTTTKTTRTRRPRMRAKTHGDTLRLTIRHRPGQTNDDILAKVEHITSHLGAVEWSTSQPDLRTVTIEAVMRDSLGATTYATMPKPLGTNVGTVDIGRQQDGTRWHLPIRGQHTLVIGCTGAGKNSVLGGILAGLAPGVTDRTVELYGVDFGGGVEFGPVQGIFTGLARNITDGVRLMDHLRKVMAARQQEMIAGNGRLHVPAPSSPLIVLAIDELAAAMYDGTVLGKQLAAEFNGTLGLFLTQGRKLGLCVVAAQQDPRKDLLALRDRFTQTVCLRTKDSEETAMALGRGRRVPAHLIRADKPGTGFVLTEDRGSVKVRADYYSDALLVRIGRAYHPPTTSSPAVPKQEVMQPRSQITAGKVLDRGGLPWDDGEHEALVVELLDGLSWEDVAAAHGRTVGGVRSRAVRMAGGGRDTRPDRLRDLLAADPGYDWRARLAAGVRGA